ncbi:hypothetical protein [Gloeocapsa sp. PCC 73106]|uniref:hypothetical protein n=1 Tax=Gloeocapsa sp. PCC 73106 TaxID=102232 RepID=UPI0002AC1D30|nr:hypothetical protein [Gloeocapsa sp. PCC 73106]ELR97597.1 hypothetical protein GLO73106DRAFT_00014080 [Gloeocapsa sp. PCC 73106]
MNTQLTGTISYQDIGVGTWVLVTSNQETYELHDPSPQLRKAGLKVAVQGVIREDIMTLAMIGPVFEVASFEILS